MAMMSVSVVNGMNMLIWTYFWEFTATQTSLLMALPSLAAVVVILLVIKPLSERFSKQQLIRWAVMLMIVDCLWLYPLVFSGWFPEKGHVLWLGLNFIQVFIFMGCIMMRAINAATLVSDSSNEHELKTGRAQEGAFFASMNLANKTATVFGPVYVGLVLDFIGLSKGVLPSQTSASMDAGLIVAMLLGSIPPLFAAIFFIGKVKLGRQQQAVIQRQLKQARAEVC